MSRLLAFAPFASITIDINPVIVRLGHLRLGWYGVAVGLAIVVALLVARSEARRHRLDVNSVLSVAGWALAGGFVGARLLFVIDHWSTYVADPLRSFAVQEGGLAIEGALIGGFVSALLYVRHAGLPVLTLADLAAPAIVLGQAVGRLGCLVTGDALGAPTSLPWGVVYVNPGAMAPQLGVALQPVFAYEALWDVAVFALLWTVRGRIRRPGLLFALYLGLYGVGKFGLTFFRQERIWAWGLQEAQFLAVVLVIGAGIIWLLGILQSTRTTPGTARVGPGA